MLELTRFFFYHDFIGGKGWNVVNRDYQGSVILTTRNEHPHALIPRPRIQMTSTNVPPLHKLPTRP